mmetsp:Transcript_6797/g.25364  ORF Transcript_6797/g.25364 Transcript_6797/m.25364 type:complete len:338 (-) Transcript_6797:82-1095(-)
MSVGIVVGKETTLQQLVRRCLNSWNQICWGECTLLSFCKVVLWVSVENQATVLQEWIILIRPYLGDVKHIKAVVGSLCNWHNLHVCLPCSNSSLLNVVEEITSGPVWVLSSHLLCLVVAKVFDSGLGLVVKLDPELLALSIHPLVSVGGESVQVSERVWSSTVRKQEHHLVHGLWIQREEVPERVWVWEVALRILLLGVNEIRKLLSISDEKNWSRITDHIVITVLCVMFDGETTWIACSVSRALLSAHSGEAQKHRSLFSHLVQECCLGELRYVLGHLEISMSSSSFGVHNTLWDTLSVKVSQFVDEFEVLKEGWPVNSSGERVACVSNRVAKLVG